MIINKVGWYFNKLLVVVSVIMVLATSFLPVFNKVYAEIEAADEYNSIIKNFPYYDDYACAPSDSVDDASKGDLSIFFYPECATDETKFAKAIDDYIAGYGSGNSPLKGMGNDFVSLGKRYDVNPAWAVAVAQKEGQIGTCMGCPADNNQNNTWGIKGNSRWPATTPGSDFATYPSWVVGLEDFYFLVSKEGIYLDNKKVKTIGDLIEIYCPPSECDTKAYEKEIVSYINSIMKKVCANSGGSEINTTENPGGGTTSKEPLKGVDTITVKGKKHVIPAKEGKIGYEQHLVILGDKGDGGDEKKHYEITDVPKGPLQNGYVGLPAPPPYQNVPNRPPPNPYAGSMQTIAQNNNLPLISPLEEQYYIAMRWNYSSEQGAKGNEDDSWYGTYPRVIVTNKDNGKQVVAAAGDFGPALSTGWVAGTSAGVTDEIRAKQDDSILTFAWAEDQSLEPGPLGGKSDPVPKEASDCGGSEDGGGLGVSPDGFTFPLKTTQEALKKGGWCTTAKTSCHATGNEYLAADIFSDEGTTVVAAVDGKVIDINEVSSCDPVGDPYNVPKVYIEGKDGRWYYYTHMKPGSISVRSGATIKAGQELGEVGPRDCAQDTPQHLHFQINKEEGTVCSRAAEGCTSGSTLDPQPWLIEAFKYLPKK